MVGQGRYHSPLLQCEFFIGGVYINFSIFYLGVHDCCCDVVIPQTETARVLSSKDLVIVVVML